MIKFTALMQRKADLSHEEFVEYHKTRHAPLFMSLPEVRRHVRRYVQSHSLPADLPGLPPSRFDGLTEIWFDNMDGLKGVFASEAYLAIIRPDEQKFIDLSASDVMVAVENSVFDPAD